MNKFLKRLGWLIFCIKYDLGLAREGIDFITVDDSDLDIIN